MLCISDCNRGDVAAVGQTLHRQAKPGSQATMSRLPTVAAATLTAMSIAACGSTSATTAADSAAHAIPAGTARSVATAGRHVRVDLAVCRRGNRAGPRFIADMKHYLAVVKTDPTGADPSRVEADLTGLDHLATTLIREDTSSADIRHLTGFRRGLGQIKLAVTDLQAGNEAAFVTGINRGASEVGSYATGKLAICRGV